MSFEVLESTEFKNKYFYRTQKWDWLTRDRIHVFDDAGPGMITMDYWPQCIFLEADGQKTVSEFVHLIAAKYPRNQIPKNLDAALIDEMSRLIQEKLITFSDNSVVLDVSILNPRTEEGEIDMIGTWSGTYTYNIPDTFKDDRTKEVRFIIKINKIIGKDCFKGTVEDNLETGGTPGVGVVAGRFSDSTVRFEKKMPINARIEMDGSHSIDENKKHPTIVYEGEFSRSSKYIHGTWRFKKKVLVWKGIIPFWVTPGDGEFEMSKI